MSSSQIYKSEIFHDEVEVVPSSVAVPSNTLPHPGSPNLFPKVLAIINTLKTSKSSIGSLTQILTSTQGSCQLIRVLKNLSTEETKHFTTITLPVIFDLAILSLKYIQSPIPQLKMTTKGVVELTRRQVAGLLALSLLGFYTLPQTFRDVSIFPIVFFGGKVQATKLRAYIAYFDGILRFSKDDTALDDEIAKLDSTVDSTKIENLKQSKVLDEIVVVERNVVKKFDFARSEVKVVGNVEVDDVGVIEDKQGALEADFANKYIGGGVLNMGMVQEEILFLKCPESLVSLLLCEGMEDKDSIRMYNVIKYSDGEGYSHGYNTTKEVFSKKEF
ncbi:poly ADP-ribose glycohydrolase, putative, partial [Entamoeba invadens IP1]